MTEDQATLLVRAEASIEAARLLASGRFHNFAVSRAYYAMLYAAEALLLEEGLAVKEVLARRDRRC